jgi:uncharacterized protein YndB with AHSA1/START domain
MNPATGTSPFQTSTKMKPATQTHPPVKASKGFKVVICREIAAPCALVFGAWTDAGQMAQWFSPKDVVCKSVTADFKQGGSYRIHMVSDRGDHIAIGKYLEIEQNKRLRFTWEWETYAMPDSIVTVEFEDLGKTTRLTLTHEGLPDEEDARDHTKGWTSMLEKFGEAMEAQNPKRHEKDKNDQR